MKTIIAMMLAAAFLISRPVLAGDEAAPTTEKAAKAKKSSEKKDDAKKDESKKDTKDEKKAEKGGW